MLRQLSTGLLKIDKTGVGLIWCWLNGLFQCCSRPPRNVEVLIYSWSWIDDVMPADKGVDCSLTVHFTCCLVGSGCWGHAVVDKILLNSRLKLLAWGIDYQIRWC